MEEEKKTYRNPWDIKLNNVPREKWTDPSKNYKISDPGKMDTTIHGGSKQKEATEKVGNFFKWMPGPTKSVFPNPINKMITDKNKNKIPDYMEKKI